MKNLRDIVIFGCGGFGREVLQIVLDQNRATPTWRMKGFLISPDSQAADTVQGFPVFRDIRQLGAPESLECAVGIGNPEARWRVVNVLRAAGVGSFPVMVHPRAWVGANVTMEEGVVVCAGALLTTDIALREHSHVNIGTTVGHDSVIGSFSTLSPGVHVSGRVTLG
ncbi:MAG: acetyltransferase, partial [Pseudomonadota bacterium]